MKQGISWSKVLLPPAVLFVLSELIAQVTDWYRVYPWIDIPMHFFGGLLTAVSVQEFFQFCRVRGYLGKLHPLLEVMFVTALVVVVAVFWEWHEFLRDTIFHTHLQISQGDTMHDLLMGMSGGLLGALVSVRKRSG